MRNNEHLKRGYDGLYALAIRTDSLKTEAEFYDKFSAHGNVVNVRFSKVWTFVRYKHRNEAENCFHAHKGDRDFHVRYASNRGRSNSQSSSTCSSGDNLSKAKNSDTNHESDTEWKFAKSNKSLKSSMNDLTSLDNSFVSLCDTMDSLNNLQLGHRDDGKSHLFISNLSSDTTVEQIRKLLADFKVIRMTDILRTLPEQPLRVYYVMVTLSMEEAKVASKQLNGKLLLGSRLMVLEVQDMYRRAIMPSVNSTSLTVPLSLKEIAYELEKRA